MTVRPGPRAALAVAAGSQRRGAERLVRAGCHRKPALPLYISTSILSALWKVQKRERAESPSDNAARTQRCSVVLSGVYLLQ